jgi:hypothetical protein
VDNVIFGFLSVLFNSKIINPFDFGDVSKPSLFEFKKIEKNNVYGQILAKMNGLVKHCDSSFDALKSELKKLVFFLSYAHCTTI